MLLISSSLAAAGQFKWFLPDRPAGPAPRFTAQCGMGHPENHGLQRTSIPIDWVRPFRPVFSFPQTCHYPVKRMSCVAEAAAFPRAWFKLDGILARKRENKSVLPPLYGKPQKWRAILIIGLSDNRVGELSDNYMSSLIIVQLLSLFAGKAPQVRNLSKVLPHPWRPKVSQVRSQRILAAQVICRKTHNMTSQRTLY